MSHEQWKAVDEYISGQLLPRDSALDDALRASATSGLPPINVSPNQGKLLFLLAVTQRARRILEIGTLGGYSTIWLARSLPPGGQLLSLEIEPSFAAIALANLNRAGLSEIVEVRVGPALDSLAQLPPESRFDLVFIDADKENLPQYLAWAIQLSHRGSLIIADNVVRGGAILDDTSPDPRIQGVRKFYEMSAADPRVDGTAIQTVGVKGYDGFAILRVVVDP